jgi:fructosamine-3-kinase
VTKGLSQVSTGHHGREALKGEFDATAAIYDIVPDFCPKPIAWGTLKNEPDSHFYLCKYYEFSGELPEPGPFCEKLARLHLASHKSSGGKFGFHCTTYCGDLPHDNTWFDSWEACFANGLRHVLKVREERAGPSRELDDLLPALFDKVIPRLLRPMETNGRTIRPALVHGDLWCGNAAVASGKAGLTGQSIIFDPASFYAHNECTTPFRSLVLTGSHICTSHSLIKRC